MDRIIINLINRLLSQMNVRYDEEEDALYYIIENHLNRLEVFICYEFDYVRILLGIHRDFGRNTIHDYHLIANSPYFNWKVMRNNKREIRHFLDVLSDSKYESSYRTKKGLDGLKIIKERLNLDMEILKSYFDLTPQELTEVRIKYNGHLVKDWLNLNKKQTEIDSFTISYWMEEFKKDVEWVNDCVFMDWLFAVPAKEVRESFLKLVESGMSRHGDFNELRLPF